MLVLAFSEVRWSGKRLSIGAETWAEALTAKAGAGGKQSREAGKDQILEGLGHVYLSAIGGRGFPARPGQDWAHLLLCAEGLEGKGWGRKGST